MGFLIFGLFSWGKYIVPVKGSLYRCIFYFPLFAINYVISTKIYRTTILSVVLYECETWSLTLREEHRLRVFENSVEENIWA